MHAYLYKIFIRVLSGALYSLAPLVFFNQQAAQAANATSSGTVLIVAFKDGTPDPQFQIFAKFGVRQSNAEGTIRVDLPPGTYQASSPQLKKEFTFEIKPEQETLITVRTHSQKKYSSSLDVEIPIEVDEPASAVASSQVTTRGQEKAQDEIEEVVVLAPKIKGSMASLLEVRKQTSAVTDVLGAEQMARNGDSDAAASLRRVTGLTLMNGRFVYVRGLGERYSSVQMNSFTLPSPEPSRRVVPLDLFPTAILESVVVQKSYSPNLPGEFGGGLIQLQSKTLPDRFFLKANFSGFYAEASDRLTYVGGKYDQFGFDDGSRKLPAPIQQALAQGKKLVVRSPGSDEGISQEELNQLGQTLNNRYNTRRSSESAMPGFSLASGSSWKLGTGKLGLSGSFLYSQDVERIRRLDRGFNATSGDKLDLDFKEVSDQSTTETRVATGLDLGYHLNSSHRLHATTFLLRSSSNFTQFEDRTPQANPNSRLETTTLEWTERQLWTQHLKGSHDASLFKKPLTLNWRLGQALAKRYSPDRREYAFERTDNSFLMRDGSGGNRRTYSDLADDSREMAADLQLSLLDKKDVLKLQVGAQQINRNRRSDVHRLFFNRENNDPIERSQNPEQQFKLENRQAGKIVLQNITDAADSYSGEQVISAQFINLEFQPNAKWNFQAGARSENSTQIVKTFRYDLPNQPFTESELRMVDILPVYNVTFKPSERWRARLAYSETLARPDFRELSAVSFIDDDTGNDVRGNESLKGTVIRNIDHRWEYYYTADEYVSLGAFFKQFQNPIEVMFVPGVNRIQTFENAKSAENYGLELESRVSLRNFTRTLRRWSVVSNLTLIESEITLSDSNRGIQTSDRRPLQGQSPYVVNLQLQYDRPKWGVSTTLLYNVIGPRITEVGTNRVPDTIEQEFHQLDFVATKSFAKVWSVSLRARNLLDPEVRALQRDEVVRSFRRGRTAGVNISATF